MRNRLSINLEQASVEGALITTDSSGDAFYYLPTDPYNLLMYNGASVEWTTNIRISGIKFLNWPGGENRVLSVDSDFNITPFNPLMKYDLMYSDSATPGIIAQSAAGAGAIVQINGTHRAGVISLQTGNSGVLAGLQLRVVYRTVLYPFGSAISLTPYNGTAASHAIDIFALGSGADFELRSNTSLGPNALYQWNYIIEGF